MPHMKLTSQFIASLRLGLLAIILTGLTAPGLYETIAIINNLRDGLGLLGTNSSLDVWILVAILAMLLFSVPCILGAITLHFLVTYKSALKRIESIYLGPLVGVGVAVVAVTTFTLLTWQLPFIGYQIDWVFLGVSIVWQGILYGFLGRRYEYPYNAKP